MENKLFDAIIDGEKYVYPLGTSFADIARDVQHNYPYDILLVRQNGELQELSHVLNRNCTLHMLTALDKHGMLAYQHSLILMMLAAFRTVAGKENIQQISVEHSVSRGLFIKAKGDFALTAEFLARVEQQMHRMAEQKLPIRKSYMNVEDAIQFFHKEGMDDKARLFRYSMNTPISMYTLDGLTDYFYGYMVPDTGYLRCFALELLADGFVLRLPSHEDPNVLGEFHPPMNVFHSMREGAARGEGLGISNVGQLNKRVSDGRTTELILAQEALMEKELGDIADEVANRGDIRFVMIAGPSSSGKTTLSRRLAVQLMACGVHPPPISTDHYFKNRTDPPRDEDGQVDFECLEALDVEGFNRDMLRLLRGERVEMPQYNFKKGEREYNGDFLKLGEHDILVIEGIHCLNSQFSYSLPQESRYRMYVSCLTTLNLDDHNYISSTDARLLRRIQRDAKTRGYSAKDTIRMWPSVRAGEERNIFPFQEQANTVFNTALIYETAILRPYIEPLLYAIPSDCEEYCEARRLLRLLNYFMPIPSDDLPKTSFLREFIGGGCYDV